jgi:hypothetical protein
MSISLEWKSDEHLRIEETSEKGARGGSVMSSEANSEPLVIISSLSWKHKVIEKSHVKIGITGCVVVIVVAMLVTISDVELSIEIV